MAYNISFPICKYACALYTYEMSKLSFSGRLPRVSPSNRKIIHSRGFHALISHSAKILR